MSLESSNSKPTSLVRRGRLPAPHDSVQLRVECSYHHSAYVVVEYWGAPQGLIAAGCVTADLLVGRQFIGTVKSPTWWGTRRAPTKAAPTRRRVAHQFRDGWCDQVRREQALDMPGVRELFPDGLPAVRSAPAAEDGEPVNAAAWRADIMRTCAAFTDTAVRAASGSSACGRFHMSSEDAARIAELGARLKVELLAALEHAHVIDERRPQLRIVGGKDSPHKL